MPRLINREFLSPMNIAIIALIAAFGMLALNAIFSGNLKGN